MVLSRLQRGVDFFLLPYSFRGDVMKKFVCLVLMMLFMMVGVSNAEFDSNVVSAITNHNTVVVNDVTFAGYTANQISSLRNNRSTDRDAYEVMLEAVYSDGYYLLFLQETNGTFFFLPIADSSLDFGIAHNGTRYKFLLYVSENSSFYYFASNKLNKRTCLSAGAFEMMQPYTIADYINLEDYGTYPHVKNLTYANGYYWDGESYYYQVTTAPEEPEISVDLSGLISAITSSSIVQDNKGNRDEYFIIPFGENYYEVYFYSSMLSLSQFEYLNTDRYYYDLDKTLVNDVITSIVETVKGDIGGTYFSVSYNASENIYNISYNGRYEFNQDYMAFFSSEWNPIIYTTKDIAYYLYEKDENGEWIATSDESKNIVNEVITDSEGVEISPEVSGSNSSVAETPWERFISAIQSIPTTLLDGIKKIFIPDLSYLDTTMENLKNKLGFITQARQIVDNITSGIELNPLVPPSITLDLGLANSKYDWGGEAICLDLSWYEPYKPAVDFLIICFCYGFFFWNLFRKLPDIISGVAGDAIEANYQMEVASKNSRRTPIGFNTKR